MVRDKSKAPPLLAGPIGQRRCRVITERPTSWIPASAQPPLLSGARSAAAAFKRLELLSLLPASLDSVFLIDSDVYCVNSCAAKMQRELVSMSCAPLALLSPQDHAITACLATSKIPIPAAAIPAAVIPAANCTAIFATTCHRRRRGLATRQQNCKPPVDCCQSGGLPRHGLLHGCAAASSGRTACEFVGRGRRAVARW